MLGNIPHSRAARVIEEYDVAGAGYTHAMVLTMVVFAMIIALAIAYTFWHFVAKLERKRGALPSTCDAETQTGLVLFVLVDPPLPFPLQTRRWAVATGSLGTFALFGWDTLCDNPSVRWLYGMA